MNETTWKQIANQFALRNHFPNCLGAIDGKHIRIVKPDHSGSQFFSYKNYFSLILVGVVDANYCFTCVDIGAFGRASDSHVFQKSNFGQKLEKGQ
jgi:hypothetical protein